MDAAHEGVATTMVRAAAPTAETAWERRPAANAPDDATAMTHDRMAEGCRPVNAT